MEVVLCSKKRTDDYLWVINEVHMQTLRPQGPASLTTVKFLGRHEILEVLVVSPDFHQMGHSF